MTCDFHVISVMKEINNGKIFDYIDDKEKVKEQKIKNYNSLNEKFPDYVDRFSTDVIKNTVGELYTLHVFLVYTESDKEIEILGKRYTTKAILRFDQEPKVNEGNIQIIYINSVKEALSIAKKLCVSLFLNHKELRDIVINL